jgi:hypothetical protein
LVNYETIIHLIGGTQTRTGLKVKAVLDTNEYETGIKVSDEQLDERARQVFCVNGRVFLSMMSLIDWTDLSGG